MLCALSWRKGRAGQADFDQAGDGGVVEHSGPCQSCCASQGSAQPGVIELAIIVHDLRCPA